MDVPVIFISALSDTNDIVKAFSSGGVDYITKTFHAEEVRARIATHIRISRQNRELQQLNATKDKLFSIIAHDLRGPLGSMSQGLQLITSGMKVDERVKNNLLEELNRASKTTFNLLENLLSWSKSQTNSIRLHPVNFGIKQSVC